jgi:hypothetical protein
MGMWTNPITVAETRTFVRQADDVWSDEEREAFVDFIARNPEAGDIIRDGDGVRKVRWAGQAQENAGVLGSSIFSTTSTRRSTCSWSMRRRYARTFHPTRKRR